MKGNELTFDYVHLLYYKCHKINPTHGGSYIDCPDWIKTENATINPINKKDNKCFQYAKIKPFINKYNWEGKKFPSEKYDSKKFEKNNVTIAINVLHVKKEKIYPAYVSKNNSNREKQVILLIISNG